MDFPAGSQRRFLEAHAAEDYASERGSNARLGPVDDIAPHQHGPRRLAAAPHREAGERHEGEVRAGGEEPGGSRGPRPGGKGKGGPAAGHGASGGSRLARRRAREGGRAASALYLEVLSWMALASLVASALNSSVTTSRGTLCHSPRRWPHVSWSRIHQSDQ